MRKQSVQRCSTHKSKRLNGLRTTPDQFNPCTRNGTRGLIHIQVGRFTDIWIRADAKARIKTLDGKQIVLGKIKE